MKQALMGPSFLVASVILLALLTTGPGPIWILVPALVFATIIASTLLAGAKLFALGPTALRIFLVVPAILLLAVTLGALAVDPTRPFVLWTVVAFSLLVLILTSSESPSRAPRNVRTLRPITT